MGIFPLSLLVKNKTKYEPDQFRWSDICSSQNLQRIIMRVVPSTQCVLFSRLTAWTLTENSIDYELLTAAITDSTASAASAVPHRDKI